MEEKDIIIIVISVVFGYIINLTTPFLSSYIHKGSLSFRKRRIEVIKEEYERYKQYHAYSSILVVELVRQLTRSLFFTLVFGAFIALEIFQKLDGETNWIIYNISIVIGASLGVITSSLTDTTKLIDTIANFQKYEGNAIKKLIKLGGNPEDLDKEEIEGR